MDIKHVCCFTGLRPKNLPWKDEAESRCLDLIHRLNIEIWNIVKNEGYRHFISGMALGIDMLAAKLILLLKCKQPELGISLEVALPCKNQDRFWTAAQKEEYDALCSQSDKCTYISSDYTLACLQKRNKFMVDHSSLIIAVTNGQPGGTANTIKYAKSKNKKIIILKP